jgi:sugar transferase (PEP-CTERM/EpsH1 system associated)
LKILFLANRVPYPPYRGDKLKIYNLARRLCRRHELHLLTFAQTDDDWQYKTELEKIFKTVTFVGLPKLRSALNCLGALTDKVPFQVHYFRSAEMHRQVKDILAREQFDVVHVQHLRMAQYMDQHQEIPRILDLPDAFSLYWKRKQDTTSGKLMHLFERKEQKRVWHYEKILNRYNLSLVCSGEDLQYLKEQHHIEHLALLPNGVDTETFAPKDHDYTHNHTLLFTGNMDYRPNVDAVIYFTRDILPLIRKEYPAVQFIIAGQRPVKKVLELAGENVQVTGFVKDLAAVYNQASVVVAPLRFGAGTQNKVLEAMSMGVPVVCSHIGFKGLNIESGQGAMMQTDPQSFAAAVCSLLASAARRAEVGRAGIEVIQSRFSWDIIAGMLEDYLQSVAAQRNA